MYSRHVIRNILSIIFSLAILTPALDFSKSSIKAFDRYFWYHGRSGEDTITIHNNCSVKAIIDSFSVEFNSPIYAQFEIGWIGQRNGSATFRFFESDNFVFGSECANLSPNTKRGITLSEYNHAKSSEKITFRPNEKIKIFSPYFSFCRTDLGVIVDCFNGPCGSHYKVDQIANFNGKIVFFTGLNRDTLKLDCERITLTYITV